MNPKIAERNPKNSKNCIAKPKNCFAKSEKPQKMHHKTQIANSQIASQELKNAKIA